MARRKYLKDYRLVETVDERGRIRTGYEYIGPDYRYARGLETALKARRQALAACGAGMLAFLGGLLPRSAASYAMYVMLPYLFTALPLGMTAALLLEQGGWREPFQRRHADRMENRYPPAALAWAVLPLAALAGELILALRSRGSLTWGDAVFSLCALLTAAGGGAAFSRRGFFSAEES